MTTDNATRIRILSVLNQPSVECAEKSKRKKATPPITAVAIHIGPMLTPNLPTKNRTTATTLMTTPITNVAKDLFFNSILLSYSKFSIISVCVRFGKICGKSKK